MLRAPIQSMQLLFVLCALVLCIRESAQPARKSGRAEIETQESREPFLFGVWKSLLVAGAVVPCRALPITYHFLSFLKNAYKYELIKAYKS